MSIFILKFECFVSILDVENCLFKPIKSFHRSFIFKHKPRSTTVFKRFLLKTQRGKKKLYREKLEREILYFLQFREGKKSSVVGVCEVGTVLFDSNWAYISNLQNSLFGSLFSYALKVVFLKNLGLNHSKFSGNSDSVC